MKAINFFQVIFCIAVLATGCQQEQPQKAEKDYVHRFQLTDLRLGDGVPVSLDIYLRWVVDDPKAFYTQFQSKDTFNTWVLYPRAMEMGGKIANQFESVDSVFSSQREEFLVNMKQAIEESIGENGMTLKEVIVSNIIFPSSYTRAMEKVGLQRQMLEAIQQEKRIAVEKAIAEKEKTEANSKVDIAKAEAEGRVAQINAKTEESRRKSVVAKAETEAQITRKKAQAEADRNRLLAKAELEKKTDLKNLELTRKQELDNLEIEKVKKTMRAKLDDRSEFAKVVQANPNYANYLVNKELASKIDIAVLPTGTDPNVFSGLLQNSMMPNND